MLFRSNDTATTEIYTVSHTLSLHDALPISCPQRLGLVRRAAQDEQQIGQAIEVAHDLRVGLRADRDRASLGAPAWAGPRERGASALKACPGMF